MKNKITASIILVALTAVVTTVAWASIADRPDVLLYLSAGLACFTGLIGLLAGIFLAERLISRGANLATRNRAAYSSADAANFNLQREIIRQSGRAPQPLPQTQQALPEPAPWLPPLVDFEVIEEDSELPE